MNAIAKTSDYLPIAGTEPGSMRVLICDDEPLAVRRLEVMLGRIGGVEVVATATDGREALLQIERMRPQLLLLDIEMPDETGLDVADALRKMAHLETPLIVFVTAYRRFALDAFECGAVDFLPKPVRMSRLEATIERARTAWADREAGARLRELGEGLTSVEADRSPDQREHIWVSRRGEVVRIDLDRIERVVAEGAYVRLHLDSTSYLHRESMGALESRLDPAQFVRAHRSHIVRMDQVASIRRTIHGGGELILRDSERIPLGRKYSRDTRRRLQSARRHHEAN